MISKTVQITVQMPQLISGLPTFYFIILIAGVAIVVGALVTNKMIQNARIPAFVKIIRGLKAQITSNKTVDDKNLTLGYEEEFRERLGKSWALLDLDINKSFAPPSASSGDSMAPGDDKSKQSEGGNQ